MFNSVQRIQRSGDDGAWGQTTIQGIPVTLSVSATRWDKAQKLTGGATVEEVLGALAYAAESGVLRMECLKPECELRFRPTDEACDLAGCTLALVP